MSKQGASVCSLPYLLLRVRVSRDLVVVGRRSSRFGSWLGLWGGVAGGKAKPLKAPKVDKKEYDEVCCCALSYASIPLRIWLVA
jgi:hypothetical protein